MAKVVVAIAPPARIPKTVVPSGLLSLGEAVPEVRDVGASSVLFNAVAPGRAVVIVVALDAPVWIAAGKNPVASMPAIGAIGTGFPILPGKSYTFTLAKGDRIAAIALA